MLRSDILALPGASPAAAGHCRARAGFGSPPGCSANSPSLEVKPQSEEERLQADGAACGAKVGQRRGTSWQEIPLDVSGGAGWGELQAEEGAGEEEKGAKQRGAYLSLAFTSSVMPLLTRGPLHQLPPREPAHGPMDGRGPWQKPSRKLWDTNAAAWEAKLRGLLPESKPMWFVSRNLVPEFPPKCNCEVAKQPQFPQPLLIRLVLQTLHQLRCPSLDTLQPLNVLLVVRGPKLNTGFKVRPHQCRVQGHDHCPSPAGHAISDTSQDAIGLLGHLGTLLAHIQPAVDQHTQVLFRLAAFQPLFPKPVALHGVVVTQVQDPALGLVEPHTTGLDPSIQPVQVPLQSLPTLEQINTPAQLGVVCKLTEGALDPLIQIIDKDIKQNWPQY
ncbi:hypothetical protein QYF61_000482 [Mycteria americana]|uniref:Uncharacterized protein n=1 Tax=Mycteria americana TaxID=33587 RepID=A0AAN7S4H5_MYCAM|nr:hypothetical protein QYF61_000482 [Mycteria americana]